MTKRKTHEQRNTEVARAALELLAEVPMGRLSTRMIARKVGMSQPGLFRHFSSRDSILIEVVQRTREHLAREIEGVLIDPDLGAVDRLKGLAGALMDYGGQHPGIVQVLGSGGAPRSSELGRALGALVSTQRALAAELIRQGQYEGELAPHIDAAQAGSVVVGAIQGVLLQCWIGHTQMPAREDAEAVIDLLFDGFAARGPLTPGQPVAAARPELRVAELDLRTILAAGRDPFDEVMELLGGLAEGSLLQLRAPFRPGPLLAVLRGRGHGVEHRELDSGDHVVLVSLGGDQPLMDLRHLEAPEPMERGLAAGRALAPGERWAARTPRPPRLLVAALRDEGLSATAISEPEGSGLVLIARPA